MRRAVNIGDLRLLAKRRLPRVVFDYIDGGADDEKTMRANSMVFDSVTFRPRNAVAKEACNLRTTVLGTTLELPFMLAPVGSSRLFYPRGECIAAGQAGAAGTGYVLSTLSGCRLEDVRAASSGTTWYQLYLVGGRDVATAAIRRARDAGFSALVVTIDTAVAGLRERDLRNGAKELLSGNIFAMLPYVPQMLARPGWLIDFLRDGGMMRFPNVVLPGVGPMPYADVGAALEDSTVSWKDLRWIKDVWEGPLVIKGVLTAEDARRALDAGAYAIVVSNHGGRQLDGVAPTLRALPEVVAAVDGRAEVLLDGGVRRGSDVVKALCLERARCSSAGPMPTGSPQPAVPVSLAPSKSSAPTSFARCGCSAATTPARSTNRSSKSVLPGKATRTEEARRTDSFPPRPPFERCMTCGD